jgi:DNA-binding response OmpR family regulator
MMPTEIVTDGSASGVRAQAPDARAPARILIVEDNEDLAYGLRRAFQANGYDVEVAADGARALQQARSVQPHLIVLDLMIPVVDGFTVLATLRDEGIDTPVLILSAKGEEADKVRGFRSGADDYVTKPFGLLELLARVSALLRRSTPGSAADGSAERPVTLPAFDDIVFDPSARRVFRGDTPVPLTPKEYDLLLALLRQPGAALSRVQLLREVWGHAPDVQTRTVDIHIAELRKKLEHDPAHPQHIMTVWKTGYRFDR